MVVAEIVTAVSTINALIKLFKGIVSTYRLGRELLSDDWKNEYRKYVDYLEEVEREVTLQSHCSETAITGALKLLEGELKEAWSFVDKWMKKSDPQKRVTSSAFIEKLRTSRTTIAQNLQLLSVQWLRTYREQEGNPAGPQKRPKREDGNHGKSRRKREKEREEIEYKRKDGNHGKSQRKREKEREEIEYKRKDGNHRKSQRKREKEKEEIEYKAWLRENITKCTDSWRRYSERCTNSKLDRAEKKILFEKHVKGLHEQFLKDYRQLLKKVITHQRATQNIKCLKSWSNAEHLLRGHQRFGRLPKEDREPEWRIHANQILKKMNKQ